MTPCSVPSARALHHLIAANPGQRLSNIAYPAVPIETGVPYVERVVKQAFAIDGISNSSPETAFAS